jgi:hypothetical protein
MRTHLSERARRRDRRTTRGGIRRGVDADIARLEISEDLSVELHPFDDARVLIEDDPRRGEHFGAGRKLGEPTRCNLSIVLLTTADRDPAYERGPRGGWCASRASVLRSGSMISTPRRRWRCCADARPGTLQRHPWRGLGNGQTAHQGVALSA